jgi:hypothetical protein
MKFTFKWAALALMMSAASTPTFATAKAENLVRGIVGPVGSSLDWAGYSVISLIPGAGLIPVASKQAVLYLGFTAGTQADISAMVLYTTAHGSPTIKAVTPVTYGGSSSPSIDLATAKGCIVEISAYNPCIVRLDPVPVTPSALDDYYLVVYFTTPDANNDVLGVTQPSWGQTSLRGTYETGNSLTTLAVGGSIPATVSFANAPFLLMYVMTD